jgi:hypothetical protein
MGPAPTADSAAAKFPLVGRRFTADSPQLDRQVTALFSFSFFFLCF